jgi:hypothetical protein
MRLKTLVAALGLVASLPSFATISTNSATGASEAFLVVYDAHGSYALDLGITFNAFLAIPGGTSSLATLSSANWTSFLSGADMSTWQYSVIDTNNNFGGNNASVLSTINPDDIGNPQGFNSGQINSANGQINNYQQALNITGTHVSSANGDSFNPVGTPAYFLTLHTDTFNGFAYNNSNAVGTSALVEQFQRGQTSFGLPTETALGTALFSQVGSAYQLNYTVAAVPEPGGLGLGLAGVGVLGFIGTRRRTRG